jgi:hypothetical protein
VATASGGLPLAAFSLVAKVCAPSNHAAAMVSQAAHANLLNFFMFAAPSRFLLELCFATRAKME